MGRKGRSAESHDSAETDLLDNGLAVIRDLGHESLRTVYAFSPIVTLDGDLDIGLGVAGEILARADRLYGSGNGGMDERGHESARLGDRLADLNLVAHCHYRLGRSPDVLGKGNVHGLGQRKRLDGAAAGDLGVIRMHATD